MYLTYVLECGYFCLSIFADIMHENNTDGNCHQYAPKLVVTMDNIIFLLFLRSLRFMSILIFALMCGIPILCCRCIFHEKRPDPPAKLNQNLNKVMLGTLYQLRNALNYKPKGSFLEKTEENPRASTTSALLDDSVDLTEYGMDINCCICLESFANEDNEDGNPYSSVEVVVLPCKAHYFHEKCI